ncbi:sigma-70 family RNA polymerase sigma factor [Desnuesiella massiliensis]|uniref:sigma-70 family RNA polymerase sigma factor n=1 Tax=Desnuesiella massiliensis TaxID=1650662 RepID=UPI0006E45737|nr:sigma-70 family RNA polymerase sigma factor [Desnuesiella massiliensis]
MDFMEGVLESYGDRVLKLCYIILKDLHAAQDLTQEVFIQVYKSRSKFREESSLYTWIYKIAINKCRTYAKRHSRMVYFDSEEINLLVDNDFSEEELSLEESVVRSISSAKIKDIITGIKPIYREVILLYYFEDLSIKDIAEVLEEKESTIKSKLFRARELLKQEFIKEGIANEAEGF